MKCKNCGKEYYNRECPTCKNKEQKENLAKLIIKKKKSTLPKIAIPIIIIILLLFISPYIYINYKKIKASEAIEKANIALEKLNDKLSYENTKLRNENTRLRKENYITKKRANNMRIVSHNNRRNSKPIPKYKTRAPKEKHTIYRSYNNVNTNIKKPTKKISRKKFPSYNGMKLVSDSKIRRKVDNRLTSNLPIYGEYDGTLMHGEYDGTLIKKVVCPENPTRLYKTIKECYVITSKGDILYFSYMKRDQFKNYRGRNKKEKIECEYSKEHGIMHSCSIISKNKSAK